MGCVSEREQKAGVEESGKSVKAERKSSVVKGGTGSSSLKKLTSEEITKKRQDMRYNLQEGNSQPPNVIAPHFGSVTTFDTTT